MPENLYKIWEKERNVFTIDIILLTIIGFFLLIVLFLFLPIENIELRIWISVISGISPTVIASVILSRRSTVKSQKPSIENKKAECPKGWDLYPHKSSQLKAICLKKK